MEFIFASSFLVCLQLLETSASARIHSEFPKWFQYQVCIVPLIIQ